MINFRDTIDPETKELFEKFRNASKADGGLEGQSWEEALQTKNPVRLSDDFIIRFLPKHVNIIQRTRDRVRLQLMLRQFLEEMKELTETGDGFVIRDPSMRKPLR